MVFIDRIGGGTLAALAVLVTVLPAVGYSLLGRSGYGGLVHNGKITTDFFESLYFSIVTEATLGYGDLSPTGWARLLACVQVVLGLLLAGLAVAKLSALQGRATRSAVRRCVGTWIEPCCLEDKIVIVTVSVIKITHAGLVYEGSNYLIDGKFVGSFKSGLTSHTDTMLEFHYTTSGSSTEYFQEGIAYLKFWAHPTSGVWVKYVASVQDFGKMRKTLFEGMRATPEQEEILFGNDKSAFRGLIAELGHDVKPTASGPLLDVQDS